ncbi:MAG: flap endonuclease-1 [Candidatus Ranarchaeia archaeon]
MGTKINELFTGKTITFDDLKNKTLIVDAFNQLYMYLSSIRQSDGGLLKDSKGNVTSHLAGLFNRFTKLMKHDIKFVFVFDGKAPDLKMKERERRMKLKEKAELKYKEAKQKEDIEEMKKYAQRTTKLTKEMIDEAKKLISALGFPIVQAKGEGEAQACLMVNKKEGFAVMSQDADSFLFGAPRVVKNLTITGRRKRSGSYAYDSISPELFSLSENLNNLGLDQDQLIIMAMLTGTDYNIGGIKGIGPKKALDLVKKHGKDFEKLFEEAKWNEFFDYEWKKVFDLFKSGPVNEDYKLKFERVNPELVKEILVENHEFSRKRIEKVLKDLNKKPKEDLTKWFG